MQDQAAAITVSSLWSSRTSEQQDVVCEAYNKDPEAALAVIDNGGGHGGGTPSEVEALHRAWDDLLSWEC